MRTSECTCSIGRTLVYCTVAARATIEFDSVGRKTVVVRYANLEPDWD